MTVSADSDADAAADTARLRHTTVNADTADEYDSVSEDLSVTVTDSDDYLSILSVSGGGEVAEGDSGTTARATFTVTLSPARRHAVSVSYATSDGTAEAGSDYESASGTVTFSPGETSKTVAVTVNGDDEAEGNETFTLALTSIPNGTDKPSELLCGGGDKERRREDGGYGNVWRVLGGRDHGYGGFDACRRHWA